jgi:tetratricopeptide (TPR) repeat protein/predicted Ser/Thr protein kinase
MDANMAVQTLGKYQILRVLGRGGMGTVYEALDPQLNRKVAIKTMIQGLLGDPDLRARFAREAQAAGSLNHRNIVTVYDLGEDKGQPYIAMEFIEGTDLESIVHNRQELAIEVKVSIILQICEGLGYAHRNGIIHRDIKPANIRVTPKGEVKIMDFGIAHLQAPTRLTKGGLVLGTIHYTAPEQVEGGKVDHRADIFSVGAIAYELLAYKRPFDGESVTSIMFKIAHEDPDQGALPHTVYSPRLEQIVFKALTRDVNARYQGLDEMAADVERLVQEVNPPHSTAPADRALINRWIIEGEQHLQHGDFAGALQCAKRVLAVAPAEVAAQALARKAEAEALGTRMEEELAALRVEIVRARDEGRMQKALGLVQRLLHVDPDDKAAVRMEAEIQNAIRSLEVEQLCGLALSYVAEGEINLALKIANKIEKVDPQSPKYADLRKYLQEELSRRTAEAFVGTAREHLALGNLAEARAAAEEALVAFPQHTVAREIRDRATEVLQLQPPATELEETPRVAGAQTEPAQGGSRTAEPARSMPEASAPAAVKSPPAPKGTPRPAVAPDEMLRPSPPPPARGQVTTPGRLTPPPRPRSVSPLAGVSLPDVALPMLDGLTDGPAEEPAREIIPPPAPSQRRAPQPFAPPPSAVKSPPPGPPPAVAKTPPPPVPTLAAARAARAESPQALVSALRQASRPEVAGSTPAPAPPPRAARPPTPPAPVSTQEPGEARPRTTQAERDRAKAEEALLTPLPEGTPSQPEAARLLETARRLLRERLPERALEPLQRAAEVEPEHLGIQRLLIQTRIESRKAEIEALTTAALNHFVENNYAKARKAVRRALDLDPNNKKAKELNKILSALG